MDDLISRQDAIDALMSLTVYKSKREIVQEADKNANSWICGVAECIDEIEDLPYAQPETCEGCKHLGKWENEVEYGYPSPCTRCKRRAGDHYER